ncbi:hypothetical protein Acin_1148 [Acidaminococcus intestini RyC-MR95]|uniref:Uncharacterized protein n=1 Tax=Acidaminococcus intestini (strain RyC-MR95) TaxID=568816 RepID=G4Q7N6_ACIIR|nr:hypothetical protein Acin_1148 [Acidaminococcus intestini RyC-MR95]
MVSAIDYEAALNRLLTDIGNASILYPNLIGFSVISIQDLSALDHGIVKHLLLVPSFL